MQTKIKLMPNQAIVVALMAAGILCIVLSVFNASSYAAILGGSLIFWGSILVYIAPSKHVPIAYLTASTTAGTSNIERLLSEIKLTQKGIYLPQKNLTDTEFPLVFIPKTPNQLLPKPEKTETKKLFDNKQNGLFLTPPGLGLFRIFQQKLGVSFTKMGMDDLLDKLPKLLTENLEIAEKLEIQRQENKIIFLITGSIFEKDCSETQKFEQTHNAVGCLLSSSIACIIAAASGKPVVIEKEAADKDGKTRTIEYRLMRE